MAEITVDVFDANEPVPEGKGPGAGSVAAAQSAGPTFSAVPENKFGTKEPIELQMLEDVAGTLRAWEVLAGDVALLGKFDLHHLRDIHAHVMQDIYAEPGATRGDERMISEHYARLDPKLPPVKEPDSRVGSNGETITLLDAGKVNGRINELSAQLQAENELRGLEKADFVNRLADYYLQYSQASPFISGNEQVLGVVANKIGFRAGYHVDIINATHVREATDSALAQGIGGDKSELVHVLSRVTREAEGIGAQAARSPTMMAMPLAENRDLTRRQTE